MNNYETMTEEQLIRFLLDRRNDDKERGLALRELDRRDGKEQEPYYYEDTMEVDQQAVEYYYETEWGETIPLIERDGSRLDP